MFPLPKLLDSGAAQFVNLPLSPRHVRASARVATPLLRGVYTCTYTRARAHTHTHTHIQRERERGRERGRERQKRERDARREGGKEGERL